MGLHMAVPELERRPQAGILAGRKTLSRELAEKAKISRKQGQDSCPANFSLALPKSLNRSEPSGLAGKCTFSCKKNTVRTKVWTSLPFF